MGICENSTKMKRQNGKYRWSDLQMLAEEICIIVLRLNISPESTSGQQNFLASPHSALEQTVIEVVKTQISILAGNHRKSNFPQWNKGFPWVWWRSAEEHRTTVRRNGERTKWSAGIISEPCYVTFMSRVSQQSLNRAVCWCHNHCGSGWNSQNGTGH